MDSDTQFERIARGDTAAFDCVFLEYYGRLFGYLHGLCADAVLAEELAQEAFVRFWQHRSEYQHRGNFAVYIFTVGRNLWLNHCKSNRRRQETLQAVNLLAARTRGDAATVAPDEEKINSALSRLPQEQREVVMLKVFHEMTFPQISEMLGVHCDAVVSRYRYGIKKLADQWNTHGGGR